MANYSNLKAAIAAAIKQNGNQEITGQVLQDVLTSMVSVIGANYTFAGVATPATNPGTPDQNLTYLAMEGGTYTNFNGMVLPAGISLLMWNGTWTSETVMYGDGGVFDISVYKSSGGTLATFADLSAALDGGNNIPASARKGGMSVKFVQSSDNKYVQYFLPKNSWSIDTDDWQKMNLENEVNLINQEINGIIDAGTTYNQKDSTDRVCVYYPIIDVNADFRIKLTDVVLSDNSNSISIAIRSGKTPYSATEVLPIMNGIKEDYLLESFTIPEQYKQNAKYLAITQLTVNGTCSFNAEVKINGCIKERLDSLELNEELNEKRIFAIDGIIDDGTTHNEKYEETRRTCVFYNIPDVNSQYCINISNVVVPSGVNLFVALRSGKTPYSATFLSIIGAGRYTQDTGDIYFEIPDSFKSTAKYISVCQEQANDSLCSFDVLLKSISNNISELEMDLNKIAKGKQIYDIIPYNDYIFTNGRLIRVYNPYKEEGNNQYTGQTHCHTWSYVKLDGVTYKVPIGYTVEQIAAMTEQEREQAVESVNQQFVAAHKTVGYDFMTITNYDTFADYTPKPQVMPANFLWLCNGFEASTGIWDNTGTMVNKGAHIVILSTDFGKIFDGFEPKDIIPYCEDRNAIASFAHPFLNMLYTSPEYFKQIKGRLRFIEVFNSLGVYHPDVSGVPYIKQGIELDEDFDALISQGNFTFCMAVSDQRNLGTTEVERNHLKEGCIKVFANELTNTAIWSALLSGNFYATENVDLELQGISLADNILTVNVGISGMTVEFVKEDNEIVSTVITTSENLSASYTITGNEKVVRARIFKDGAQRTDRMWTQPIFLASTIID